MSLDGEYLFNQEALQGYIILCCQHGTGGLKDKPGKYPDIYHTCYSLSGASVSQGKANHALYESDQAAEYTGKFEKDELVQSPSDHVKVLSANPDSALRRINPIYNGRFDKVEKAKRYFRDKLNK